MMQLAPFLVSHQTIQVDAFWRHVQALNIEAICPRPRDFSIDPSLTGRIRSALGPALRALADQPGHNRARRQRLYGLPSAFKAFFGEPLIAPVLAGDLFHNPTRPFVLQAWGARNRIHIQLRLFGKGAIWQEEADAGLRQALANGIQLAPGVATRVPLVIEQLAMRMVKPCLANSPASHITLDFSSPVAFERRDAIAVDRDMLFGSLLSRSAGIAAWHGMLLDGPWAALVEEAGAAAIDLSDLRPVAWERRSMRQRGRKILMKGLSGRLDLHGWFEHWLPLLALIPVICLGSHTTLGMGMCQIRLESEN